MHHTSDNDGEYFDVIFAPRDQLVSLELRLWSVSSVSVRGLGAGHRPGCQDESINILTLHCILTNTQLRLHFLKLYL